MFNNSFSLLSLDEDYLVHPQPQRTPIRNTPCLPSRLPSIAFISREAGNISNQTLQKELDYQRSSFSTEDTPLDSEQSLPNVKRRQSNASNTSLSSVPSIKPTSPGLTSVNWREPQAFEIFRAIERKDILLLRRTGDATPLLHAMRIGKSHRDVAILLVGALSRFVNHLEDEDLQKPQTKSLLKALRANLKLAIDYGLQQSQKDLIASFMQCLIMSEGEKWVWNQTATVALALRAGGEGKPVECADQAVRKFATKELGKATLIAALEDYIANATVDLLLLAAWTNALNYIDGEAIPSYYFARDDRIYKAFTERAQKHKSVILRMLPKKLKWQMGVLERVLEGRTRTYHSKVEVLAVELHENEPP
ncbi:hypothetical protein Clacol_001707 [Clathrus columnatus]|uniref:Uncharacterized protein n=1 Tax=Clathrus columnatus TaxID=1419009 RepID=A0AAV5A3C3_9AGAM|nr:hypothetical protein Clacol_001707 [Clathrus columnatus]